MVNTPGPDIVPSAEYSKLVHGTERCGVRVTADYDKD